MGASDDYVAIMGDWFSPRTAFSSMRDDDIEPQSLECIDSGNQNGTHFPDQNSLIQSSVGGNNEASNSNSLARFRSNPRGGLVERMAARAGFNAPRLNVESIKPPELYKSPDIRSPYLTIPPGISPTALLESPVFLSNPMVHPSPTTGKLPFFPGNNRDSEWMAGNRDKGKKSTFEETNASSYAFRAVSESSQITRFNAGNRSFHSGEVYLHSELQHTYPPKANPENKLFHQSNFSKDNGGGSSLLPNDQTHYSTSVVDNSPPFEDNSPPFDEQQNDEINGQDLYNDGNSGEDGYNWRKYGQKHVKGIEYPRSYYKCTHHNCPVKKKVERSHEGHITEIIYKGGHNHPKPLFWSVMQNGNTNNPEYNNGGVTNEIGDGVVESKNFSTNDDEDRATHGSFSLGRDGEGDEFESKKMRTETPPPEMFGATRAIREPRVVVQTKSEIDILDDGYRWRKYGQKVVKGNPNPRSYYKCTSQGCNVRKHVERASHDLKSVITTYEGKHNHEVPAARNSGGLSTQQGQVSTNQVNRSKPCPVRGRSDWLERPQLGPLGVGPGFGFGMNQPGPTTFGLGTNLQRFPVHTYAGNQVRPVNEMAYMMPKEELLLDSGLSSVAGSSGYYQQLMSQLPLGPQM